ncbi:hypothetical protein F5883DRAFT_592361 [Diaporthe sp. PMI_573]|nr:hypothetical protein F5883DRAFT_592361 [Diaporthaceae sp. PMI_573]
MAETPYFNAVTSESLFKARFKAERGKTFSDIDLKPANKWGREELFACRVIRRKPQSHVLPLLSEHIFHIEKPTLPEIDRFLEGPTDDQMAWSEHDLVRECGILGQAWAAMAILKRRGGSSNTNALDNSSEDSDEPGKIVKRVKLAFNDPCYVDSGKMQVGSSSPLAEGSQGEASSVGHVDQDSHNRHLRPEDDTLRLTSCMIRHLLYFAPPQDHRRVPVVVEFRDSRSRLSAFTPRGRKLTAIDDGGLCLRQTTRGISKVSKNNVAKLEAKRNFQCVEDGQPIISDGCFAQITCEALVARFADPSEDGSVIIINAIQHYICFLEFKISQEYLDDFESDEPTSFLLVNSTHWLDLCSKSGREHLASNIRGLMYRARVS